MASVIEIDAVLPQTQCEQCGYKGCLKYAEAISDGAADINRCPPGGEEGILKLSKVTGIAVKPLNVECGVHVPFETAFIQRNRCIGCRLCINACPTEAIIGYPKHMHVVDASRCTGCSLCAMVCPMDCIEMVRADCEWTGEKASQARQWFRQRNERLKVIALRKEERLEELSSAAKKKVFLASLMSKRK